MVGHFVYHGFKLFKDIHTKTHLQLFVVIVVICRDLQKTASSYTAKTFYEAVVLAYCLWKLCQQMLDDKNLIVPDTKPLICCTLKFCRLRLGVFFFTFIIWYCIIKKVSHCEFIQGIPRSFKFPSSFLSNMGWKSPPL